MTRLITVFVFIVIVLIALLVESRARVRPDRIAPIDDMLQHAMTSRITRVGVTAAWWWFGWHFLFAETVQLEL